MDSRLFSICYLRFAIFDLLFEVFHNFPFVIFISVCHFSSHRVCSIVVDLFNDPAMTNDKWKMTNGKSQIENRKYQIENSKYLISLPKVPQSSQPLAYLFTLFIGHCARRLRRLVFDCIRPPDRVLSHVSRSEDFFQHPAVHIRRDLDAE